MRLYLHTWNGRQYHLPTGVVKIKHNGSWGTICDDGFDHGAADVLCRKMGYRYGFHNGSHSTPEQQNMTIWLDNLKCTGDEVEIDECHHDPWGQHDCNHNEDVVIGCTSGNIGR